MRTLLTITLLLTINTIFAQDKYQISCSLLEYIPSSNILEEKSELPQRLDFLTTTAEINERKGLTRLDTLQHASEKLGLPLAYPNWAQNIGESVEFVLKENLQQQLTYEIWVSFSDLALSKQRPGKVTVQTFTKPYYGIVLLNEELKLPVDMPSGQKCILRLAIKKL